MLLIWLMETKEQFIGLYKNKKKLRLNLGYQAPQWSTKDITTVSVINIQWKRILHTANQEFALVIHH